VQDEVRKIDMKRLIRGEKGYILIAALLVLVLVGLISGPLLSYMVSGLRAGHVFETGAAELYAADAGVEDAIWKLQHPDQAGYLPCSLSAPPRDYTISDINGKTVGVIITYKVYSGGHAYLVESTATGDESETKITAYLTTDITSANYSGILDNVLTSPCDYTLGGPTQVDPEEGEEHGPEASYGGDWPTAEILSNGYIGDVESYPYASATLDVKNYASGFGPLYRQGTLSIVNTGTAGLVTKLNGTIYVTGDTLVGTTDKAFTLNLNGQTIFVESATGAAPDDDPCNPPNAYALKFGTKCTLKGSGCIIAVGGIEFKPNLDFSPGDFVFVLSVKGKTYMQPNGDFYGSLAGSAEVYIQNGDATWFDSPFVDEGLNFPYVADIQQVYNIVSWDVSRQ
jgi:hypothetical protein